MAIMAEGDPQFHCYKITGKQNTSALITDDYGTAFPQTLIYLTRPFLSEGKYYSHDLQT